MTKRFILANIQQFVNLAIQQPSIRNLASFRILQSAITEFDSFKGCKCKVTSKLNDYRVQFETALQNMTTADQNQLKQLLQAEEVCYYTKKAEGGLTINCF